MPTDATNMADTLRILKDAQAGGVVDPRSMAARLGGKAPDAKTIAFQAQMQMARQAIAASNNDYGLQETESLGMDANIFSDSMMMDALSTIAKLTGEGANKQGAVVMAQPEKMLTRNPTADGIGSIAAQFESGDKGIEAIGFDRTGGTSYGKYQIASRVGTMNRFLNFLSEKEPAWADRLRKSGPANTGSTHGRMPAEWAKIAGEDAAKFERLQTEFIKKDHYQPAREKILMQTGVDIDSAKPAVREALFSTAVQHGAGGAARIFNAAIDKFLKHPGAVPGAKSFDQALVSEVYTKRQDQFGSSTGAVRASVRGRLKQEKDMVLAMLDKSGLDKLA
jgi:hypothetical protein